MRLDTKRVSSKLVLEMLKDYMAIRLKGLNHNNPDDLTLIRFIHELARVIETFEISRRK